MLSEVEYVESDAVDLFMPKPLNESCSADGSACWVVSRSEEHRRAERAGHIDTSLLPQPSV